MRQRNDVFSGLLAAAYQSLHVRGEGLEPQIVNSGLVEGSFFSTLGLNPTIGRLIGPDDDHAGQPSPVAVWSWTFWKGRFILDPSILGKEIIVDGVTVTIVGVTPRNFSGLQVEASQDLWLPLAMEPGIIPSRPGRSWVALVGGVKPGVSRDPAPPHNPVLYPPSPPTAPR